MALGIWDINEATPSLYSTVLQQPSMRTHGSQATKERHLKTCAHPALRMTMSNLGIKPSARLLENSNLYVRPHETLRTIASDRDRRLNT